MLIQNHDVISFPKNNFSSSQTIHQYFENQVDNSPDSTAIFYNEKSISYSELNIRSNQLAHLLIQQGITPEQRIGLCLHRSIDMVVSLLAILKAGATYVPIDVEHPKDRIQHMLQDTNCVSLITHSSMESRLSTHHIPLINIDIIHLDKQNPFNPNVNVLFID